MIIDGLALQETFYIYRQFSVWRMDRIAADEVWSFRPVFANFGVSQLDAIATDGNLHYVWTGNDLIAHDGQRWQSLLSGRIRRALVPSNAAANVVFNEDRNEIWVAYTRTGGSGGLDGLLVYHIPSGQSTSSVFVNGSGGTVTGIGVLRRTVGVTSTARPVMMRNGEEELGLTDSGATDWTNTVSTTFLREDLDFGAPHRRKLVKWVRPYIYQTSGSVTITVEAGARDTLAGAPTYSSAVTYTTGTHDKVNTFTEGRYLTFRFVAASGEPFALAGFDVGYEETGDY
jgi:hypothetical protein